MRATKPTVSNLRNAIDATCCELTDKKGRMAIVDATFLDESDRPQVRTATEVLESSQPDPTLPNCPSVRRIAFQHLPAMYLKQERTPRSIRADEFTPAELRAIADDLERSAQ